MLVRLHLNCKDFKYIFEWIDRMLRISTKNALRMASHRPKIKRFLNKITFQMCVFEWKETHKQRQEKTLIFRYNSNGFEMVRQRNIPVYFILASLTNIHGRRTLMWLLNMAFACLYLYCAVVYLFQYCSNSIQFGSIFMKPNS